MLISDWSSDVCSSDLPVGRARSGDEAEDRIVPGPVPEDEPVVAGTADQRVRSGAADQPIGPCTTSEAVGTDVSVQHVSVRRTVQVFDPGELIPGRLAGRAGAGPQADPPDRQSVATGKRR